MRQTRAVAVSDHAIMRFRERVSPIESPALIVELIQKDVRQGREPNKKRLYSWGVKLSGNEVFHVESSCGQRLYVISQDWSVITILLRGGTNWVKKRRGTLGNPKLFAEE